MLWGLSAETWQAAGAAHAGAVLCVTAGRNIELLKMKRMLVAMQYILKRTEHVIHCACCAEMGHQVVQQQVMGCCCRAG